MCQPYGISRRSETKKVILNKQEERQCVCVCFLSSIFEMEVLAPYLFVVYSNEKKQRGGPWMTMSCLSLLSSFSSNDSTTYLWQERQETCLGKNHSNTQQQTPASHSSSNKIRIQYVLPTTKIFPVLFRTNKQPSGSVEEGKRKEKASFAFSILLKTSLTCLEVLKQALLFFW